MDQIFSKTKFFPLITMLVTTLSFIIFFYQPPRLRSAQIRNLNNESWFEQPKEPVGCFGAPGGHFGFWRQCGVAGGQRVPPSPLGWYWYLHIHLSFWSFCNFWWYFIVFTFYLWCCGNYSIFIQMAYYISNKARISTTEFSITRL